MFEGLTENLSKALRNLRGLGKLTDENMAEALGEVRKALLSAAKLLATGGETDKAKEVCDEFLGNKLNEQSPDFAEIKQYRKTL